MIQTKCSQRELFEVVVVARIIGQIIRGIILWIVVRIIHRIVHWVVTRIVDWCVAQVAWIIVVWTGVIDRPDTEPILWRSDVPKVLTESASDQKAEKDDG